MGGSSVFVSYRRSDSPELTGRLRDRLVRAFGVRSVFTDFDSIAPGADFRDVISAAIRQCQVVLVVIGPRWLDPVPGSEESRLSRPDDYVRMEIETALASGVTVIPVLAGVVDMPPASALPESIRGIAFRNAARVRHDPDFHSDVDKLLAGDAFRETAKDRRKPLIRAALASAAVLVLLFGLVYVTVLRDSGTKDALEAPSDAAGSGATAATVATSTTPDSTTTTTSSTSLPPSDTTSVSTTGVDPEYPFVGVSQLDIWGFTYLPQDQIAVAASSESSSDPNEIAAGIDYAATNLIDGTLEAAWQEGVEGLGVGSQLVFTFPQSPAFLELVEIYPGWQTAKPCLYQRHAKPTAIRVEGQSIDDGTRVEGQVHEAMTVSVDPGDARALLRAQLPPEVYSSVTLTVTEVEPGEPCGGNDPFEDMLISEVQFANFEVCGGSLRTDYSLDLNDLDGYVVDSTRPGMPGYVYDGEGDAGC